MPTDQMGEPARPVCFGSSPLFLISVSFLPLLDEAGFLWDKGLDFLMASHSTERQLSITVTIFGSLTGFAGVLVSVICIGEEEF